MAPSRRRHEFHKAFWRKINTNTEKIPVNILTNGLSTRLSNAQSKIELTVVIAINVSIASTEKLILNVITV